MRALTVRQPWAACIAIGRKTVENRTRGTSYRGPLAIHAGVGWSDRGARDRRVLDLYGRAGEDRLDGTGFTRGAVIAVAELADSHPDGGCCRPWGESEYVDASGKTRRAVHHLILDEIRMIEPVHTRGRLGLWIPDDDLRQAIYSTLDT